MSRVVLITGAAGGIGQALARTFIKDGYRPVLSDSREDRGRQLAEEIGCSFLPSDLTSRAECRHLVEEVINRHGVIDVLINNAGFQHIDSIDSFPEDTWDKMLSVMLTAPFLLTRYAWPGMKRQQWGRIVNVASIHAQVASPFKCAYIAAKHGLLGLTRVAALEGGQYGITVNAVCPAYVKTPLVEDQIIDQARTRQLPAEEVIEKIMLEPAAIKRLIDPEEVAHMVLYLCSDRAGAVTGAAWNIDLGWTAR